MRFLGIDLGWRSQPSGLCCLELQAEMLHVLDLTRLDGIAEILAWVDGWVPNPTPAMIAVDAPTLIPNAVGMRVPDRLTHKYFGKYHAGCYPANQGSPFAARTVGFGLSLEARGFAHAPTIAPKIPGRYQIEVFPHPAMVHLFDLPRILKYKKGKVAERRSELIKLRQGILTHFPCLQPALSLAPPQQSGWQLPTIPETGVALKAVEDQLDALICAYVAAYWWIWGADRNQVLGDRDTGYIVVPKPRPPGDALASSVDL